MLRQHETTLRPLHPRDHAQLLPQARRAFAAATVGALLLLTSACGALPTQPLAAFSQSLVSLKDGTDSALAVLAPRAETRFKRDLIEEVEAALNTDDVPEFDAAQTGCGRDADSLLKSLLICSKQSPFVIEDVPLFLVFEKFRLGASQTTGALVAYSQLLRQLADPELLPPATFRQLATDLNANAFQALSAMHSSPGAQAQANVALLSTLAVAATEAYLRSKQKKDLVGALQSNQSTIEEFAGQMQEAVDLIAAATLNEYNAEYEYLNGRVFADSTRQKAVDDLIVLDRSHIQQIGALQQLRDAYGRIPAAHLELASAIHESGGDLAAVVGVLEAGQRLQAQYDQAIGANRVASAQATVSAAKARADARSAEAETAALRAAGASAAAVAARLDANASPADQTKARAAANLEDEARELKQDAERLKTEADALRAAADAVQREAEQIKRSVGTSP